MRKFTDQRQLKNYNQLSTWKWISINLTKLKFLILYQKQIMSQDQLGFVQVRGKKNLVPLTIYTPSPTSNLSLPHKSGSLFSMLSWAPPPTGFPPSPPPNTESFNCLGSVAWNNKSIKMDEHQLINIVRCSALRDSRSGGCGNENQNENLWKICGELRRSPNVIDACLNREYYFFFPAETTLHNEVGEDLLELWANNNSSSMLDVDDDDAKNLHKRMNEIS